MIPIRALSKLRVLPLVGTVLTQRAINLAAISSRFIKVNYTILVSPTRPILRSYSDTPKLDKVLHDRLKKLTTQSRVVILMKGNPQEPQCGFSNAVCRILEAHGVLDKKDPITDSPIVSSFNILSDDSVREGAKLFSDWPTFPQVYIDGEFIGGCDILLDMHRSGKLVEELEKRGIGSTLKGEDAQK